MNLLIQDLNAYYEAREAKVPRKKKPTRAIKIEHYNHVVAKTKDQLKRINFYATLNPPEEWEWIYINGKKTASWIIWQSRSESWSINLSVDGELVAVNEAGQPLNNADVCIEKIENLSEAILIRGECTLFDISNSISARRKILGLSFDSNSPDDSDEDVEEKLKRYHSSK